MYRKEIYAIGMLAAIVFTGVFAFQPADAQRADDGFAGSDIDIPIPDVPIPAPSDDASNPQIHSNTALNLIP